MATDSKTPAKPPGPQEARQLAAMKEKLAGLEAKQKEYADKEDHPDYDRAAARERIKAQIKELSDEIKKLSK